MYIMEAKYRDVEEVMSELSPISLGEMAASGVNDAWNGLKRAKTCREQGFLKVIKDGQKPLAIFGAIKVGSVYRTWFVASEAFFAKKIASVKVVAREMKRVAERMPHAQFEAATLPQHPAYRKWFNTVGFKFVNSVDGVMVFRYIGRVATRQETGWLA